MPLNTRIDDLAAAIRSKINAMMPRLLPAGGTTGQVLGKTSNADYADGWINVAGSNSWVDVVLASDYTNATVTFANITDGTNPFTFTPPANTNYEIQARVLIWTTAIANLPRLGVSVAAGTAQGYGAAQIAHVGATATTTVQIAGTWNNPAAIVNTQMAAGGVLTASTPWLAEILIRGRSGATPQAISLQMACETAAANTCFVKAGSRMSYRTN